MLDEMSLMKGNVKQSSKVPCIIRFLKQEDLKWTYNGSAALKAIFSEISL